MEENKDLVVKYSNVLELIKDHKQHNNIAILLEISVNYINMKYKDVDIEIKTCAVYIIKELYLKNLISSDVQTTSIIDDFINYYNTNYNNFIKDYDIDVFDLNMLFIKNYISKIINSENNE